MAHTHVHTAQDTASKTRDTSTRKTSAKPKDKSKLINPLSDNSLAAPATLYDLLSEQIKGVHTHIDSIEKSFNGRIDDVKMIVDKTDKRISTIFVVIGICATIAGIFSAGIFTILGIILSKIG